MKKYPKIKYPTHEKTDGLLTEGDEIVIQEKVDGANFRYTVDEDGEITFGSRNCVNPDEQFEHAEEYVERTSESQSRALNPRLSVGRYWSDQRPSLWTALAKNSRLDTCEQRIGE